MAYQWLIKDSAEYFLFYQLDVVKNIVSIPTTILINKEMEVTIALEGILMDPLDYTRHIPINGRISHWNQLRNILIDFGFNKNKGPFAQDIKDKIYDILMNSYDRRVSELELAEAVGITTNQLHMMYRLESSNAAEAKRLYANVFRN
ncbi:hypothetical protein HHI36_008991 [Cryptolaemus montrouzieri]|uniref:Uncharacterized protein n=1 Tax=Cryptolaemus montrouzieri TaxID=559131 RepID=A0ABD2MU52_9CUCU